MYSVKEPSQQALTSSPIQNPRVAIRRAPGIELKDAEVALLQRYFSDYGAIFVERAFHSGYSGALVLLVSPGTGQAPVVIKLTSPEDLAREYKAYHQHVAMSLPQNTARLQTEPLLADDGRLGLLCYTFAGGDPSSGTNSLHSYYETKGGVATTDVLNRIFRVYGRNWWAVNRPQRYILGEQYDRFLPVHLQLTQVASDLMQPLLSQVDEKPIHTLQAGRTSAIDLRKFSVDDPIRLHNFQVAKIDYDQQSMILIAEAPVGEASAPIRLRFELKQSLLYQPGDVIETLDGIVNATRRTILADSVQGVLPGFKADVPIAEGSLGSSLTPLRNPIYDLENLLDRVLENKISTIHGDLNLQNILVDEATGFAWLIDFAETRIGPTFIDPQRLEAQVITKLLPSAVGESAVDIKDVAELIESLHVDLPAPVATNAALQEPYTLLVNIRRLARQYLMDDQEWGEYYLGLVVVMLGVLKFEELDTTARQLALTWMTLAYNLVDQPLKTEFAIPSAEPVAGTSPFKGLQYFEEKDADLFFGREVLTAQLVNHLHRRRFLAVIGASGSGKSSLVRAGLVPALKKGLPLVDGILPPAGSTHWPVRIMTPEAHPLESLATMLVPESEPIRAISEFIDDLAADPRSLHLYVRRMFSRGDFNPEAERLLLIVDQFEETFTLCRDREERQALIDNLLLAARADGPTIVVITLRADFYAHCSEFEELRLALEKWQRYIGPMSESELRRAIEAPARQGGWEFEPRLVSQILRDVGDEPGALPLLSHTLLGIWNRRRGRTMTFRGYAELGYLQGAIAKSADKVLAEELNQEERQIVRKIFLQLTELGEGTQDTRRRVALNDLLSLSKNGTAVQDVLDLLANERLITLSEETAEVAHEALIREWPQLRQWLAENREKIRKQRKLSADVKEWDIHERDPDALYRGARLEELLEWVESGVVELTELEHVFLEKSKLAEEAAERAREAARQRELTQAQALAEAKEQRAIDAEESERNQEEANRKLRRSLAGVIFLLLLAFATTWFAWNRSEQLNGANERLAAQAQQLEIANTQLGDQAQAVEIANEQLGNQAQELEIANKQLGDQAQALEGANKQLETQALKARAGQLAAQAQAAAIRQPQTSILLALEAIQIHQGQNELHLPITEQSLREALAQTGGTGLNGHTDWAVDVAFSPDGRWLASASEDHSVHLWDSQNPTVGPHILSGHTGSVNVIRFSPDGRWLASASDDTSIRLWNTANPDALPKILDEHEGVLRAIDFSPNGRWLASASDDYTIRVWNVEDATSFQILEGHEKLIRDIQFSPDSRWLASASSDLTVRLWDVENSTDNYTLHSHEDRVKAVSFSPNGRWLASASLDQSVRLWDMNDLDSSPLILNSHDWEVLEVNFSPDGRWIASAGEDQTIHLWQVREVVSGTLNMFETPSYILRAHEDTVRVVTFSPDSRWLASASDDTTVRMWDLLDLDSEPIVFRGHTSKVRAIAFSPDAQQLVSASEDHSVRLWDLHTSVADPLILHGHPDKIRAVAFGPNREQLVSSGDDSTVRIWDTQQPSSSPHILDYHQGEVRAIAIHPDGTQLVTANAYDQDDPNHTETAIAIWNLGALDSTPHLLSEHDPGVNGLAFHPSGEWLASAHVDNTIRLWNMQDSTAEPEILQRHEEAALAVAFSSDGQWLASADEGGVVYLWDAADFARTPHPLCCHAKDVRALAFSPDSQWLASASEDATVNVWNMADPNQEAKSLREHTDKVTALGFSPDSQWLASAGSDTMIRLWDMADLDQKPRTLRGHVGSIKSVMFSPDGNKLASAGSDLTIRLWTLSIENLKALACRTTGRNLTQDEWEEYFEGELYRKTCPELPIHPSIGQAIANSG